MPTTEPTPPWTTRTRGSRTSTATPRWPGSASATRRPSPGSAARRASTRSGGEVLEVLDSDAKIPLVGRAGDLLYNFWRDAEHERGLWRRTTLEQYRTDDPEWETLLDLDALSAAEGESWVWHGAQVLRPDCRAGAGVAVPRRLGRRRHPRVRPRDAHLGRGRLRPPGGQGRARLGRRGHRLRLHRPRPRHDDDVGLPAHRAPLDARHGARRRAAGLRGRGRRPVHLRRTTTARPGSSGTSSCGRSPSTASRSSCSATTTP